jgi:hypothetical protein
MVVDVLDLSCSLEGCLVQPGVCAPLDELRDTLDQLPNILTQVRVPVRGSASCPDDDCVTSVVHHA